MPLISDTIIFIKGYKGGIASTGDDVSGVVFKQKFKK